uniref:aspartate--tRNA ligase n=1 Tax=Corethron hystrix TaxID=216773 RepID=A0A7S1B3S7_9STRA
MFPFGPPSLLLLSMLSLSRLAAGRALGRPTFGRPTSVCPTFGRPTSAFVLARPSAVRVAEFRRFSGEAPPPTEKTEEEKAALKAARELRKAEKERKAREKKAKKAARLAAEEAANRIDPVTYLSPACFASLPPYGDYETVASRSSSTGRVFVPVSAIGCAADLPEGADEEGLCGSYGAGDALWVRARLASVRVKGGSAFLVLRTDAADTLQAVYFKTKDAGETGAKMLKYLKSLTAESVVDVYGTLSPADVRSCSVADLELAVERVHCASRAQAQLPFQVEDAARSAADVDASQDTDRPFPRLGQEIRLDHRWMDLRTPAANAILRIQSAVGQLFRESLLDQGFVEIHTPKLIRGESESGAGVFTTDYFGATACLAQSPQIYKQMAVASDLTRVFEVGPVFRAENSNTRRHLCEFTGLDFEMAVGEHYLEALEVAHRMFRHIFEGLESRYARELATIRTQYHSEPLKFTDEPCVLHWPEAMDILEERGFDVGDRLGDLTGAMELALGEVVREKHRTDFFMLDRYPSAIRPFYTMPCPDDPLYSNSYDMFLRGQEICSGAQRCHDVDMLLRILKEKGVEDPEEAGLGPYLDSFRCGVFPHAGAGIGLERVVFLYLGLDNVRKASMFPRDPNRCSP